MLQRRNILILINGEPADGGTNLRRRFGKIIHDVAYQQQDVVKIDFSLRCFLLLIRIIDSGESSGIEPCGRLTIGLYADTRVIIDGYQRNFGPIDFSQYIAHGQCINISYSGSTSDGTRYGVTLIFDEMREWRFTDVGPHTVELAQCRRVKSSGGNTGCTALQPQLLKSSTHFGSGFHRKRNGKRPLGLPCSRRAGIGDASRNGTGLACACTGDDAHRAIQRSRRPALLLIEPFKNLLRLFHDLHCGTKPKTSAKTTS